MLLPVELLLLLAPLLPAPKARPRAVLESTATCASCFLTFA